MCNLLQAHCLPLHPFSCFILQTVVREPVAEGGEGEEGEEDEEDEEEDEEEKDGEADDTFLSASPRRVLESLPPTPARGWEGRFPSATPATEASWRGSLEELASLVQRDAARVAAMEAQLQGSPAAEPGAQHAGGGGGGWWSQPSQSIADAYSALSGLVLRQEAFWREQVQQLAERVAELEGRGSGGEPSRGVLGWVRDIIVALLERLGRWARRTGVRSAHLWFVIGLLLLVWWMRTR